MKKIPFLFIALAFVACKKEIAKKAEHKEEKSEWIYLLDETNAQNWRAYKGKGLPPGWTISDRVLKFDTELKSEDEYTGGTDVVYGAQEFENFEFYVEWKIPKGANSGIFYHINEAYKLPQYSAPEYQIIDDINYAAMDPGLAAYNKSVGFENPSQLHPLQQTASNYAMYAADPEIKKFNPAGEWNSTKIVFTQKKVEHWLNGEMVLSYVPWSEDWQKRKDASKWDDAKAYGTFKTGLIGFQDHNGPISFKNAKIKQL
ncbi:3-keto-disaccharide hydrolase [Urechidicola vernalis]|uniref:DUF1080 domain-containing protein n=1 Tax=Urechidicola vernalis TaxID=3075600 RepID=A0ABU2Y115_9FLAO|nr:DUF1080 domain-containing protein [Urechidicola sp. P050]MDT0551697.1 DUF1080 domain-containing protein [Urechidicola sp. P050]